MEDYGKFQKKHIDELSRIKAYGMLSHDEIGIVDDLINQANEHMQQWHDYTLRFHCNTLDICVKPIEFTQEDIYTAIDYASIFFGLLSPKLKEDADSVAKIVIKDEPQDCELSYNWNLLKQSGLITKDALILCFLHEMCHEYLYGKNFMLFQNEIWLHELAVDMIVGAYAQRHNMTIGHYKYAISRFEATPTHPNGRIREDVFLYGYEVGRDEIKKSLTPEVVLRFFPNFVFSRMPYLIKDWKLVKDKGFEYYLNHNPETIPVNMSYGETLKRITKTTKS